ncbi:hypothetical protein KHS38_22070 [Mucilaginibacter sp. Bleaf8]|uniref:hypothetical protein n=1 Tax=Mucilaginibacter sp. Bleaf8 TaxID=2834430 RepID=UPI001BD1A68D|nr:hypothetical protein [Mucilaginibacter sp. Bleaf8]MBS7567108.1 hypothetical protein [Mucilaginibacter sp. Bleaf8]
MNFSLTIIYLVLQIILSPCHKNTVKNKTADSASVSIQSLHKHKADIDKLFNTYAKRKSSPISVYVKRYNSKKLEKVINEQWPEQIEYTYNIIKNPSGKIVQILASPTSESGDWDICYIHYFNNSGRLIAFERRTNFFNSGCTDNDEAVHETICSYYNNHKVISKSYKLADNNGKNLVMSGVTFLTILRITVFIWMCRSA